MANVGAHGAKQKLDWVLGGAAATQPASRTIALTQGQPSSISALGEVQLNSGYSRHTLTAGAAASNIGGGVAASVSNQNAMTFGPFSSNCSILGLLVYDTLSINSGNIWWYGTLLTNRTILAGDSLTIASGALTVSLT